MDSRADLRAKRRIAKVRDAAYVARVVQQSVIISVIDRDAVLDGIAVAWQVPVWMLRGEPSPTSEAS